MKNMIMTIAITVTCYKNYCLNQKNEVFQVSKGSQKFVQSLGIEVKEASLKDKQSIETIIYDIKMKKLEKSDAK